MRLCVYLWGHDGDSMLNWGGAFLHFENISEEIIHDRDRDRDAQAVLFPCGSMHTM